MSRDYIYLAFLQANSRSACNISFSWASIISFREGPDAGATGAQGEFDAAIDQFSVLFDFWREKKEIDRNIGSNIVTPVVICHIK